MKKNHRSLIAAALALCIVGGALPTFARSSPDTVITASAEETSGTCGDNLTWTLGDDGTLTISGNGDMYGYYYGESPFFNNTNVKNIVIENGVTSIGSYAFSYCTGVESITIPDSVINIGYEAFRCCSSIESITIPNSITSIGGSAFEDCTNLKSITIPNSVTSIGDMAFQYCTNLESITIPAERISHWAFGYCTNLESITITDSVVSIGNYAFEDCTNLKSITIPNSVTSIGNHAFVFCKSLEAVTILNPDCEIYDLRHTICNEYDYENDRPYFNGTIYGYDDSTAQSYAEKYGYNFESLGEAPTPDVIYGDANEDGSITMADAVLILQATSNPDKFGIDGSDAEHITQQGLINADCSGSGDGVTSKDALAIQKYTLKLIDSLPEE